MTDPAVERLSEETLAEHWCNVRRSVFESLKDVFRRKARADGLTQDRIAARLGVDKSLVSRRLRGVDNLTLRSLSDLARAMDCRLVATIEDLREVGKTNRPRACTPASRNIATEAASQTFRLPRLDSNDAVSGSDLRSSSD